MTVDPLFFQSTTSLARPVPKFYPADIEVSHHQLRNFISTSYNGKIFYVNKYDIYLLDLESKERSILVTVPFEARCLAAAHGWVCVGGETKGDCAFIHIGEDEDNGQPGNFCHELLVEMVGKEIVNSMTIQLLKPELEEHKEEVVVLISNNDHTVTIYSLTRRDILATIEHPQPMNYALLSPDSTIMAAVGDENKVYFMERVLEERKSTDSDATTAHYPIYDWVPLSDPDVPRGINQPEDFSFAVAFSPNGRLCAVSSQGGAITIFDMDLVAKAIYSAEDAIVCTFTSSRPSLWGCVRSMAFSPTHWDVLAWTEDHGRVGLADVRQGFLRRQHVDLSRDNADKVLVKDVTPAEWTDVDVKERLSRQHQQRMQALRGHPPVGARLVDEGRRQAADSESWSSHVTLDSTNTSHVGEQSDATLARLAAANDPAHVLGPFSINYTSQHPRVRQSASTLALEREYDVHLLNPSARLLSSRGPRRRSSVILTESQPSQHLAVDQGVRNIITASPGPISDDGMPPPMSTNDLTPASSTSSSQPLPYNIPPSDPWHVIEASLSANRNRRDLSIRQSAGLRHIENAIHAEGQLANRLERQLADEQRLSTVLRSELERREAGSEVRERLFATRQDDTQGEETEEGQTGLSPSLERHFRQQLHGESDHGQRRSQELELEVRLMSRRVNQLMDERDTLLHRHRSLQSQSRSSGVSAQTSALPTTLTLSRPSNSNSDVEIRLLGMEEDRQVRSQRIEDLEQQIRVAESRVELASLHTSATRSQPRSDPLPSTITSRTLPNLPPTVSLSISPTSQAHRSRLSTSHDPTELLNGTRHEVHRTATGIISVPAQNITPASSNRATVPRSSDRSSVSELNTTRVTDSDLRLARMMFASGRASADANGNWTPAAVHRYLTGAPPPASTDGGRSGLAEIIRESGVGTAGVGWSPDGLRLYAGTEQGIFEFELNVQDRLQCPAIEMR